MTARTKKIAAALALAAAAGAAWLAWALWLAPEPLPQGLVAANGRIEGDRSVVAARYAGRVKDILVREGDTVAAGDVLARQEDDRARARLDAAARAVDAAEARAAAVERELAVLEREVPLTISRVREQVAAAGAAVAEARARAEQAARDANRYRTLEAAETVAARRREEAELRLVSARQGLAAAEAKLRRSEKALAEAKLGPQRIAAKRQRLVQVRGEYERALAEKRELASVVDDLRVLSPVNGTVVSRLVEPGEMAAAGGALFEVVDLDSLYLRAFVPETERGRLAPGQAARIYTDAFPDDPFAATLGYIASRAEFTPKHIQTKDERTKLVYEVKLYVEDNRGHRLTPGLPADAVIRTGSGAEWARPRW